MLSRKRISLTAILLIICLLAACGPSSPSPGPEPTEQAETYTKIQNIRYWPVDADYDTCDYALIVDTPKFAGTEESGYAMNLAVGAYLEELAGRVEKEYMPLSVTKPPYTQVTSEVDKVGTITNIVFTEEHCYEVQPIVETYVLMLDERGAQVNLRDHFLSYHADELIAAALEKKLAGDEKYGSPDAVKLLSCIDVVHRGRTRADGCTVYIPAGAIADIDLGELAFDLSFEEAAPDYVGEGKALTQDEYRRLTAMLGYVSNACVVRGEDITAGAVSEYAATSFMGELAQTLDIKPEAGRISVPKAEFESLFTECFGTDFPGIDSDAHDIRLEDDSYSVRFRRKEYRYNVDMLSVTREGGSLSITGDLIFGDFGFAATDYICHVEITAHENEKSPFGFTVDGFRLSL